MRLKLEKKEELMRYCPVAGCRRSIPLIIIPRNAGQETGGLYSGYPWHSRNICPNILYVILFNSKAKPPAMPVVMTQVLDIV